MRWNLDLDGEQNNPAESGVDGIIDTSSPGEMKDVSPWHDSIQYAEYNDWEKGHYLWHTDTGKNHPLRKISVTLQMSDSAEYEGGDLLFDQGISEE